MTNNTFYRVNRKMGESKEFASVEMAIAYARKDYANTEDVIEKVTVDNKATCTVERVGTYITAGGIDHLKEMETMASERENAIDKIVNNKRYGEKRKAREIESTNKFYDTCDRIVEIMKAYK